jgi:predicted XRE-type DNA-binding protein
MKNRVNRPTHVTRGNVPDDLGFSSEEATALKFKAALYQAILKCAKKYSQKQLQVMLGEPQPRVSELLNGKIAHKTVDKLLHYAGQLGIEAHVKFRQTRMELVERALPWAGQRPANRKARVEFLATLDDAKASLNRGEGLTMTRQSMRELADEVKQRGKARLAAEQQQARR